MRGFGRCALIVCVICAGPWLLPTGTLFAFDERGPDRLHRTITFAQRVAYQYLIEEVYWRHRIWPKDNPQPKPPLDAVIRRDQVETKVEDYLRKSQAVADQRGWAITTSELQAEMDRMARDTKQPVVLQELFAAVGNDPFIIAECLARPTVAQQLANELIVTAGASPAKGKLPAADTAAATASLSIYRFPEILDDCTDDTWTAITTVNAPQARGTIGRGVWTGSEMIIWGGSNGTGLNTGGRYNPSTDTWTATSTTNAPTARGSHTLVWTGTEVIVWGGYIQLVGATNTGGRYNPVTNSWIATSTVNAADARFSHTAVWTGSEMIVWGGAGCGFGNCRLNTGGRYDSVTDSWTAIGRINVPEARFDHTAQWSGKEMIVWGGTNQTIALNTGGKYNPGTDSWIPTSTANAPLGRVADTAIWSGSEMIAWGGYDSTITDFNTGGRYNPIADSWTASSTVNAPSPRDYHTAVWTGREMIVWGGELITQPVSFDTGGRYDPGTDNWRATDVTNGPHARNDHTAVWTGEKMIVWGGSYWLGGNRVYLNTGGTYCAQSSPTPTPTATISPSATVTPTPTATPTPRVTPTPRIAPTPRTRPTPAPRPVENELAE
jgi:N-acetylneuraminic acid mutarotase